MNAAFVLFELRRVTLTAALILLDSVVTLVVDGYLGFRMFPGTDILMTAGASEVAVYGLREIGGRHM